MIQSLIRVLSKMEDAQLINEDVDPAIDIQDFKNRFGSMHYISKHNSLKGDSEQDGADFLKLLLKDIREFCYQDKEKSFIDTLFGYSTYHRLELSRLRIGKLR